MNRPPKTDGPGQAPRKRPLRVAGEIQRDLPALIRAHVPLPEGILISIVEVELSDDLSLAKVYFSVISTPDTEKRKGEIAARVLNEHKGVLRHEISQRMIMRQHPDLRFFYDETPARAARIEQLLKQARDERENPGGENG